MKKRIQMLRKSNRRMRVSKPRGFARKRCQCFGAGQFRKSPMAEEKAPSKKSAIRACRQFPVKQPERADVFEVRVETLRPEHVVREWRQLKAPPADWTSHASYLGPESKRTHHVLAETQLNHGAIHIGKRERILLQEPVSLGQPGMPKRKRLMAGESKGRAVGSACH